MTRNIKNIYPLSCGQEAMWFIYQIAPESVAYNIFITVKIDYELKIDVVNRVWQKIIEKHPILRTTYTNHEGKPVQQVNQQENFSVEVIDSKEWSEEQLAKKIYATADRPFNLEQDSVLRVNLFSRSAEKHILMLTMHHIAGDMWSFDLLLSEFQTLYLREIEQISQEQTETVDYLSEKKSYADFVHWQSEMLSSSQGEKLWQHWQEQLAGELPILNLLPDKPRPAVQTYQGASYIVKLDEQLTEKLNHLAVASKTSLYQILLTAFYIQLYRYTNQTDILISSPMRGRRGGNFEEIVGYFVNLTVLRVSVQENATFQEFLAQVSKTVKKAQYHQDYPFGLLAQKLQPQKNPSRSPLSQVSFTWQRHRWCELTEKSSHIQEQVLQMEPYLLGHQRGADLDLNLMVMEAQGVLQPCWQYNTDLFNSRTIERMAGHYITLLESIVTNPQESIAQLPLLTEVEKHQLLTEWNDTQVEYPVDKCIHELFEEQVEKTPDAVAVVFENQQLTYQQLNIRANQLANYLQTLGVKPETLIGICVERSLEMVIGLLGILKAGGAYVPLDPEYPQERLSFMLEDAQVSVLLTQKSLLNELPLDNREKPCQVICLDENTFNLELTENPSHQSQPNNLAYVIYTSGSTGRPKGVMIEHSAIVNLSLTWAKTFQVENHSRLLQFGSFSFDLSVGEISTALVTGACLYLGNKVTLLPSQSLVDFLTVNKITHSFLSPSALSVLPKAKLPDLQYLTVGGEACTTELVNQWGTERNFYNCYGPTESTVTATIFHCQPNGRKPPIGKPISNLRIYILDRNNQLLPPGIPGELCIAGVGLARGYLNRPQATTEKFMEIDICGQVERIYRTGDLARWGADGNIEYLGRIDNQVKCISCLLLPQ
nr:amino acid adenylation domain-containing protein [Aphanizomenon flos-aquae]